MKKHIGLLAMYSLGTMMASTKYNQDEDLILLDEVRLKSPKKTPKVIPSKSEAYIPSGCQNFVIDGIEVIALNEKNAIRKAAKLKANDQL